MRKSDRLFEIIQILRSHNKSVTAEALAEELEMKANGEFYRLR